MKRRKRKHKSAKRQKETKIVRCGINYDRQPYEPARYYDNVNDLPVTAAGIALVHTILTHYGGYGFYEVDEMLLPLSRTMVPPVQSELEKHFKLMDGTCTVPIVIQAQADYPRTCVSCNVAGIVKSCEVFDYPTILTTPAAGVTVVSGVDSQAHLVPQTKDTLISIMSERDYPQIVSGGPWDDMHYDLLPPMTLEFFQMFMKYLVAIVCHGDRNYQALHLSDGFPEEYLHPIFKTRSDP